MASRISLEACPVATNFKASFVNGKWGPPNMLSPNLRNGIARLAIKYINKVKTRYIKREIDIVCINWIMFGKISNSEKQFSQNLLISDVKEHLTVSR
jgi:hypothetical protein